MRKPLKVYRREKYLSKVRPFYSSDVVKVITGIRRSGKSCILLSIMDELRESGVPSSDIIHIPLDKRGYKEIKTPEQLEESIAQSFTDDELKYIFIDEVQNVTGFESVVLAFQEEGHSVFLTGSNSYPLSDEIGTKLTGRYITFEVFPLTFDEYIAMKKFLGQEPDPDTRFEFSQYLLEGGFPKALEFGTAEARRHYTGEVIDEIIRKDVRSGRNKIKNKPMFDRVLAFVVGNYSSPFSASSVVEAFRKRGIRTTEATVNKYVSYIEKAKIIYSCPRFDAKSKDVLNSERKYYLADLSIYFARNTDNRPSYGASLENLVYIYLRSRGYSVSVGRVGKFEVEFITRDNEGCYAYIQVCWTLEGGDAERTAALVEREYRPFRSLRDGYPRYLISMDPGGDHREGVRHYNAVDLFLGKVSI